METQKKSLRLELVKLALQPKVEAKITMIKTITQPLTELELQQPRRTIRGD